MLEHTIRHSPIHAWLASRSPRWSVCCGMPVAVQFDSEDAEQRALESLALCDQSATLKLSIKGPRAADWLAEHELPVPTDIYAAQRLDHGSLLVRLGADEFFLQGGLGDELPNQLLPTPDAAAEDVYCLERQDATLLLSGRRSPQVLAQTCGLNFAEQPKSHLVFTRIAGVSVGVFPDTHAGYPTFQLWADPSYALDLWESLVQILESLEGTVVGLGCLHPELQ